MSILAKRLEKLEKSAGISISGEELQRAQELRENVAAARQRVKAHDPQEYAHIPDGPPSIESCIAFMRNINLADALTQGRNTKLAELIANTTANRPEG